MSTTGLVCDDSVSLTNPEMDEEHRTLYAAYRTIRASLEGNGESIDLRRMCSELLEFARDHFAREEGLMAAHAYPDLEVHRKLHAAFLQQIGDISAFVQSGGEPDDYLARFLVQSFIGKWLKMHTLVADRKFDDWLRLHARPSATATDTAPPYPAACAASPSR